MPRWWEYQPTKTYNRSQRRQFEHIARNSMWNDVIAPSLAKSSNSADPDMAVNRLPTSIGNPKPIIQPQEVNEIEPQPDINQFPDFAKGEAARKLGIEYKDPKRRGILGVIGEATEAIGLDDIDQPWDILRPVKRILDAEHRYIAKPMAQMAYENITGDDYETAPGLVKFLAENVLSPSTYIGPGTVVGAFKLSRGLGLAAPSIIGMARSQGSGRAFKYAFDEVIKNGGRPISGGAADPKDLATFLKRMNSIPDDIIGAKGIQEVYDIAKETKSYTQKFRGKLDTMLTPDNKNHMVDMARGWTRNAVEDFAGIRLFDGPIGPIISEYQRQMHLGSNFANAASEQMRIAMGRSLPVDRNFEFIVDEDLIKQAENIVPGMKAGDNLYIEDFVEFSGKFNLTPEHQLALDAYDAQMNIVRTAEKAGRVRISEREVTTGRYVHHERIRRPEEIAEYGDDLSLTGTRQVKQTMGQVVGARLGTTQSAQIPRQFASKIEGVNAGFEYLPFLEAQKARMSQGIKLLSDEWMKRTLSAAELDISRSANQLLDPDLVKQGVELSNLRAHGFNIGKRLDEAARHGERHTSFRAIKTDVYNQMPQELKTIVDNAMLAATRSLKADRVADFKTLREQLNTYLEPILKERGAIAQQLKVQRKGVLGRGTTEFPIEFGGRYYKRPVGEVLNRELRPPPPGAVEDSIRKFNGFARPLMATLDISFLGIQGLIGLAVNPMAYKTAFINTLFGGYDEYIEGALRSGLADDFIKHSGFFSARNDYGEFIFPKWTKQIPILGQGMETSNTWFSNFGNIMRLEMFKTGTANKAMSLVEKTDFARLVNKATGYTDGKLSSAEQIGLFAPRFFRAQFGILADAITKRNLSSTGAANMVARLIGEGVALTAMVNESGLGQELDGWLDPDSPNFMRMRIADHDISIFGPWDTLAKIAIKSIDEGPFDAAVYTARVKASPAIGRMWDLIEGETFVGGQTRDFSSPSAMVETFYNNTRSMLPLSVQGAMEEGVPNDVGDVFAIGAEFMGTKTSPLSEFEKLESSRDLLADKAYNKPWDDLEPYQKVEIIKDNPDLEEIEPRNSYQQALAQKNAISERITKRQERLDNLLTGRDWLDAYHDLKREQAGMYKQWEVEHPEAAAKLKKRAPKNAEEAALKSYYDFFDTAEEMGYLPEEISEGISELEASWNPSQAAYVERNTGLRNTEKVTRYKAAQKILKPYWQVEDKLWDKLKADGKVTEDSFSEYVDSKTATLLAQGVAPSSIAVRVSRIPLVQNMNRAVSELRERLRLRSPELDSELVEWYGYRPIREQLVQGNIR